MVASYDRRWHDPAIVKFAFGPLGSSACAPQFAHSGGTGSEPASFQTPLVALDIFRAQLCQTELSFLKFPADQDEALLFSFGQCLQACAFGGRLPIHANGAVQQYHYLDNFVSPWLMHTAVPRRFTNPVPLS